jgi:CRP/FNR family transcriptional regulator
MFEGAAGDRVMVLLEGRVKVTHTAADGQETVVSIRGPGEIVGELPCLDHRPQLGSVGALEPGRW